MSVTNMIQVVQRSAGLAAGLVMLCSCQQTEPEQAAENIRPVRYQEVVGGAGQRVRTFTGTSRSGLEASLSFKVSGTIARLPVNVGDRIKRGQVIAELDPQDYALVVQQAQAALTRAQASARNAAANYSRTRALYENRNASKDDLDSARAQAESTRAGVRSNIKQLELAKARLSYTRLTSPAACSVAAVPVEVNENVGPGQPVVEVVCGKRQEIEVTVPEGYIARIKEGSQVTAALDAFPGRQFKALVTKVGVAAGQTTTTFPVTVELSERVRGFRSGMAAEVTFRFARGAGKEGIIVPSAAVGEDREGRFVFVIEDGEPGFAIVRRRAVTVGKLTPDGLLILAGLAGGERIVTAGVSRLSDGRKVKLGAPTNAGPRS